MRTPRSDAPVYEPVCCPLHSDTCGLADWCCDSCPEAGLVAANPHNKPYARVAQYNAGHRRGPRGPRRGRRDWDEFPKRAMTDANGQILWALDQECICGWDRTLSGPHDECFTDGGDQ